MIMLFMFDSVASFERSVNFSYTEFSEENSRLHKKSKNSKVLHIYKYKSQKIRILKIVEQNEMAPIGSKHIVRAMILDDFEPV